MRLCDHWVRLSVCLFCSSVCFMFHVVPLGLCNIIQFCIVTMDSITLVSMATTFNFSLVAPSNNRFSWQQEVSLALRGFPSKKGFS